MSELIMQQVDKLRAVVRDMPEMVKEVLTENKATIEDMNIAQLDKGMRADGTFNRDYSPVSVQKYGKRPGPVRLHDEGDFWRGIEARIFDNAFEMVGNDIKTGFLLEGNEVRQGFGIENLGISAENIEVTKWEILAPELIDKARKKLTE